jgi:alkaline phosphatase
MKKITSLVLAVLMMCCIGACSGGNNSNDSTTTTVQETTTVETDKVDWVSYKQYSLDKDAKVNNIILMIGDGMGENIIKASEIVKGDKLVMSGLANKTYVTTYSQSVTEGDAEFTDSAASATAISTGTKTYNAYIGVDKDGNNLETICEYAQKCGMKTGLVDRHYVCHATPAGMAAHNTYRGNYKSILKEMIESDIDVMFGGGSQFYTSSVKKTAEAHNYKYVTDEEGLMNLTKDDGKVLGLLAYDNMKNIDYAPTLTTSTAKALELLENDNGFFLMVEGSNIDVSEAQLDMDDAIKQVKAFDHSVNYVMNWAQEHPGTLVIVTADHETGGVTIPDDATADDIDNSCFTSGGDHTNTNVLLMADGAQSAGLCKNKLIDNTDIAKYMRKVLSYKKK